MQGPRHMPALIFRRTPHVDDLEIVVFDLIIQVIDSDLRYDRQVKTSLTPRINAASQIALHIFNPHARQTHNSFLNVNFILSDYHDLRSQRDQAAGPDSKLSAETDVN